MHIKETYNTLVNCSFQINIGISGLLCSLRCLAVGGLATVLNTNKLLGQQNASQYPFVRAVPIRIVYIYT